MDGARRIRRRIPLWGWLAGGASAAAVLAVAVALIVAGLNATPPPAPLPATQFNADPGSVPDPVTEQPPTIGQSAPDGAGRQSAAQPSAGQPNPEHGADGVGPSAAETRPRSQVPTAPLADDRLVIPAVGVNAPVGTSGIADGELVLPSDVADTTMWDGSAPIDGDTGTILVAGHVDNVNQGPGAMWPLHLTEPGDAVYLTRDGTVTRWKIVASQAVTKANLPQTLFTGKAGPRLLKLVTCGGQVVHDSAGRGSYVDNVVITAVPF